MSIKSKQKRDRLWSLHLNLGMSQDGHRTFSANWFPFLFWSRGSFFFGKAMANGMPLSAVVGRREIMEVFDDIFFSGTFGGETLSLAACKATITEMESSNALSKIHNYGSELLSELRDLIDRNGLGDAMRLRGYGARSLMEFPHLDEQESRVRRTFVMQECVKRGLLYFGVHMPTAAHGKEELDFTLSVMGDVMPLVAAAYQANDFADRLDGDVVEPIFRKA